MRADKWQTCGSVAVPHGHQAADGPLPALFGRHVEHALHLRSNDDNINTTIDPERVPPSGLEDSTGGKSCSEIQADAAETDRCNSVPKTPGGSSDTLQMKDTRQRQHEAAQSEAKFQDGSEGGEEGEREEEKKKWMVAEGESASAAAKCHCNQ